MAATSPSKPKAWKAEYAKSDRSSCKSCKSSINKESLRLGKLVQSTKFDGLMPMWNHATCILKKPKQIKSVDDVEGIEALRWDDQQKLRKYVQGDGPTSTVVTKDIAPMVYGIEASQTSRTTCRHCNQKIIKGEIRISSKPDSQGKKGLMWHHANCFVELSPSAQLEKLSGWDSLSVSDQEAVHAMVQKVPSTDKSVLGPEDRELMQQSTSKAGTKRRKVNSGDQKLKVAKVEGDVVTSRVASAKDTKSLVQRQEVSECEIKLEAQTKELWALKDDLKKYVTAAELRQMLVKNNQDSAGSELNLRDRCADGMMFGALGRCPLCSETLYYSGGIYKCPGFLSEWSKCPFSTREPERLKVKWKVPEETKNQYLSKWFKSQKSEKPVQILPLVSSSNPSASQSVNSKSHTLKAENLGDLKVSIAGLPKESIKEWKNKIEAACGVFHTKIKKDTSCLVVNGALDDQEAEMSKARRMKIPIVREDYLVDCFERQRKLPFDLYKVEPFGEASSMVTIKVKGRSAVHEASGLQDSGHILENETSIYNTTLSMSDLSTGVNSYYIIQVIELDNMSCCYVFRKWGRVGNERIGGKKLDAMLKSDAINDFKRLFLEKTGNPWEAWVQKQNFEKQPGKFFPLDIDYGVNKQVSKNKRIDVDSKLAPPLLELMKILFNAETYRAAMMEFDINMSEMPLGKLSKTNIRKGFEALTEMQDILNSDYDPEIKEGLLVDASNRFFTVIPTVHPRAIQDEDDFMSKVKMLEALQDIEIASRLVDLDVDSDESLDDKYKKLHCDIAPLPHDSEDYQLIKKYLLTTHAPTHMGWNLELEEVFALEKEGELDKFAPYREKLNNKMLLWHGSRLTNFVGILSQGLRIAPPEVPATGYMFGKGIYFADLVSKSAQYCYTDKDSPVGLMLLNEVALGEVYELKGAKYMEKPPKGKHSTKGLGKNVPQESEYVKWRNDVVVPCGKPVSSNVKDSELMYNEYIVYNTAQVKMQFLLKVRFHHKA
ncbi:BRCT domain-containing protein/PARP domain-containing protein/zf-PARP domain-containing protein/PARP_reg domain-containing protein/WGR domain-containing protein/PADR1 domain-containing protein [Cephalotus follicularis]|uniref:Poly [ADP-ribose] polymerase n=1 Tax=Cephalotus follicularis TaxID=3775 RepID=A0A1Q3B0P8_CEPFO|nr:BRCT domain-containing protein/PARP domain-containing protein/zf-PARP domain-containing protein/PARP_reg domain-containing protein/WGR domain-containing protein/PADR1 domain-containing protein [Cephalotus follicularis]